jgi:transposase
MDTEHNASREPVRRLEVFTGAGRRRSWSDEDKARIVAESVLGSESVCAVARRHGLSPPQLFGWRRQARQSATPGTDPVSPLFVPAIVTTPLPARRVHDRGGKLRARDTDLGAGMIEVEIDGVTVRVGRGAETKTIAAVLRALKASA